MTPVQHRFIYWIKERESIRLARNAGDRPPWTKDPILRDFRFCNVNREHDAVTAWIAQYVRPQLVDTTLDDAIVQLYACRVFNDPAVLATIIPVDSTRVLVERLQRRKAAGLKILRGAYLVVPHGTRMPVEEFYADVISTLRHVLRKNRTPLDSLQSVADVMRTVKGISDFMANQVCADLRYARPWNLRWPDWGTFVLAGPGTLRGLLRWGGGKPTPRGAKGHRSARDADPRATLLAIRAAIDPRLPRGIAGHLQDPNNLANCFCEFDKYERARDGNAQLRRFTFSP